MLLAILSTDESRAGWLKIWRCFMPYEKKKYFPEAVFDRSQEIYMKAYHRTWVTSAALKIEFEKYEFCGGWKPKAGYKS
jgi:hypothetical protein